LESCATPAVSYPNIGTQNQALIWGIHSKSAALVLEDLTSALESLAGTSHRKPVHLNSGAF